MGRLVALALPADQLVDQLQGAWDDGDAVAPIDLRLPAPARAEVLAALRPHELRTTEGTTPLDDGLSTDDDDALVVATSGTTGRPKGVVLTHEAVRASAEASSAALEVDRDHDRWLACLPLAHIGGLSVVTRALHTGVELDVHDGVDADRIRDAAEQGATLVSLVPAVLHRLDVRPFRRVLLGGSAIPADRPPNCVATYGMTETGSGVVYDGRPLDGVELRVVDGEVQVRGPMLLRCYRDGTVPVDDDGWLPTGDAGELTDDGELRVFGRLADVIVTGGEKVWPVAVERTLATHPSVAEVLVEGRPDDTWGAAVTAIVVPAAPTHPSLDELRDHVKQTLPAYAAPRALEVVDHLPVTSLGKVRRTRPGSS